jgi:hypothetical protein
MSSNFWNTNKGRRLKSTTNKIRAIENSKKYPELIVRLNELKNMGKLYGFTNDMHAILTSGSRPFTEKMHESTVKVLKRPEFDAIKMIEQKAKAGDLIKKVKIVYSLAMKIDGHKSGYYIENYSSIPFIESVKTQVEKKYWLSKKQMEGLNKVYNKYLKRKEKLDAIKNA